MFQKIQVETPHPPCPKEKHQSILHAMGVGWYMKKLSDNLPPLKEMNLRRKAQ